MTDSRANKIVIFGYGEMGHAMQYLLEASNQIILYDPGYQPALPEIDLQHTVSNVDFVIFCTPTEPVFSLAESISPWLQPDAVCFAVSKALDGNGRMASEAMEEGLENSATYGVLYGPMIAEEIISGKPAFAAVSASSTSAVTKMLALFQETHLKLTPSTDMPGINLSAVLKNVYAMLFGVADELGLGDNVRGFLCVESLNEITRIVITKGGDPLTPYTQAGLGDLITTATSPDSHHHELGKMAARGEIDQLMGEGINTLKVIHDRNILDFKTCPLLHCAYKIMIETSDPGILLTDYINQFRITEA